MKLRHDEAEQSVDIARFWTGNSLGLLSFLFLAVQLFAGEPVVFPPDSGYTNIREQYGAKGDGKTDDTAAFQKAAADNVRRLFIPRGVYLLSDTVHFSPKRWILQGEDEQTTVLRLADGAAGFGDPEQPKPFISTFTGFMNPKAAMGQAFRSSLSFSPTARRLTETPSPKPP
jgi:hypothetical protein